MKPKSFLDVVVELAGIVFWTAVALLIVAGIALFFAGF